MRIKTLFVISGLFLAGILLIGLSYWPSYKQRQQIASGKQAAELGARLAFMENLYYERTGTFTPDFARLEPFLDEPVPCPLSPSPYSCHGYAYTLEKPQWLVATFQQNPQLYIAFELKNGTVDCTHGPRQLVNAPICSAL